MVCLPEVEGSKSTEAAATVPSISVSLVTTVIVTGVSSLVDVASATATGGVLILIPKFTLVSLLPLNPATATLPLLSPSLPVVVLVRLLLISPLYELPFGKVMLVGTAAAAARFTVSKTTI